MFIRDIYFIFFHRRERQMAKSGSADSNSSTKPIDHSGPSVITYGDLNDPSTGKINSL